MSATVQAQHPDSADIRFNKYQLGFGLGYQSRRLLDEQKSALIYASKEYQGMLFFRKDKELSMFSTALDFSFGSYDAVRKQGRHLYNVDYDIAAIARCGVDTSKQKPICTLALARHVWEDAEAHNISALIYLISKGSDKAREMLKGAHRADADIILTANILMHIIHRLNIQDIEQLYIASEEVGVLYRLLHPGFGRFSPFLK